MRSQRRFENNAVWCERSEAALFDTGVRKGAFYVGGLLLPREVFWKRILAKSRSLRRCGCQCERVHRIMRRERPNNALGWWCPSALLRFLNRTFQNAEIRCSVWKQTEAHWSIAAAKRMNWKRSSVRSDCEFGDMKGGIRLFSHESRFEIAMMNCTCDIWITECTNKKKTLLRLRFSYPERGVEAWLVSVFFWHADFIWDRNYIRKCAVYRRKCLEGHVL